ncbi:hypothetical protein KI688_010595 [Linnemannia hyalina]|uniref:F-box domain-containing protein n=1 Tax=Linnemannia hyalina TaxID=64524 RepID=A0A9P7XVR8_9FUNG|nr:hypothetical protein KI688_010595 [Linnemannia hyalina]
MSALIIPELIEQVAAYLSIRDLPQCVRVNKTWNTLLTPLLWRTILPFPYQLAEREFCDLWIYPASQGALFSTPLEADCCSAHQPPPPPPPPAPMMEEYYDSDKLHSLHVTSIDPSWVSALAASEFLKRLEFHFVNTATVRLLGTALKDGLPHLDEIKLYGDTWDVKDIDLAPKLSACLEILASSPKLHTFVTLRGDPPQDIEVPQFPILLADEFIDLEPLTGQLKPWLCESTLQNFRAKIARIPRPEITKTFQGHSLQKWMVLEEAYLGQGQEYQRQAYQRLARLSRLERLELGYEDRDFCEECRLMATESTVEQWDDEHYQYTYLEMRLRSGWTTGGVEGVESVECYADDCELAEVETDEQIQLFC